MSVTVFVPKLADDASGAIVAEWYEGDGAAVCAGQLILRLERDFIAFDVEAEQDGVLHHRAKVGDFFFAGAIIAAIEETEPALVVEVAAREPSPETTPAEAPAFAADEDISVPETPHFEASSDLDEPAAEIPYFEAPADVDGLDDTFADLPCFEDTTDVDQPADDPPHPEPFPFPGVDEAGDMFEGTDDQPIWSDASSEDSEDEFEAAEVDDLAVAFEVTPTEAVWEAGGEPADAWDEAPETEDAPEPVAWDQDHETEDVPEPVAWDHDPDTEETPEPVALYPEDEPNPAELVEPSSSEEAPDGHPMWDDAIEASTESEMAGTWGSFEEAIAAAGEDDAFVPAATAQEYEPASPSSWDEPAGDDDETSASEPEEFAAPDTYAWMSEDAEDEAGPEPISEVDTPAEEPDSRFQPAFETDEEPELAADATYELFEAPAAEEAFEPLAEHEAPPAEEFEPEVEPAPAAAIEDPEPAEDVDDDAYKAEPVPAAVVMHMAIDLEVAPDFVEAPGAFTATLVTAVELVVGQKWDGYEPTISLVDSESTAEAGPEDVAVYDFASFGIERAEAPLNGDAPVAFAVGKTLEHVSFSSQAIGVLHRASLSMSYDANSLNELEAARLLARVRDVIKAKDQSAAA